MQVLRLNAKVEELQRENVNIQRRLGEKEGEQMFQEKYEKSTKTIAIQVLLKEHELFSERKRKDFISKSICFIIFLVNDFFLMQSTGGGTGLLPRKI